MTRFFYVTFICNPFLHFFHLSLFHHLSRATDSFDQGNAFFSSGLKFENESFFDRSSSINVCAIVALRRRACVISFHVDPCHPVLPSLFSFHEILISLIVHGHVFRLSVYTRSPTSRIKEIFADSISLS